jgi:hypothetical protein
MLVRLMYVSRAVEGATPAALFDILKKSKANNQKIGITGVLCYSEGIFLQVLEGGRLVVNALYNRIASDARHFDVMLLSYEEIAERQFPNWFMGHIDLARLNPGLLLKYSEMATLNPYAVSGSVSMALLCELVNAAAVAR